MNTDELPKGWRRAKLDTLLSDLQAGFASSARSADGVRQLRMNNVGVNGKLDWSEFIRVPTDVETLARYSLRPGYLVFNNTNSVELVGKSALVDVLDEPTTYSNHFSRLRFYDDVEPRFIARCLQRFWNARLFEMGCDRWVGQAAFQRRKLVELTIPLPALPEQRRIADAIDAVMLEAETAARAAADQLESIAQIRAVAFMSLLEDEQRQMHPVPLLDLCQGNGQYGLSIKASPSPPGVAILRMGNVQRGRLDWSNLVFVSIDDETASAYRVQPGDILFNRTNSAELVGKTAVVAETREAVFASYLIRFRVDPTLADPRYLAEIINSGIGRNYIERNMGRAIGQVNISAGKMHAFPVPYTALERQRAIMNRLDAIDDAARGAEAALIKQCAVLGNLPPAILTSAFQGQL